MPMDISKDSSKAGAEIVTLKGKLVSGKHDWLTVANVLSDET